MGGLFELLLAPFSLNMHRIEGLNGLSYIEQQASPDRAPGTLQPALEPMAKATTQADSSEILQGKSISEEAPVQHTQA